MLQITIFYNQGNRGWTEVWYKDGTQPPFAIPSEDDRAFSNAIKFRAPLTTIEWVRYSVVGSPQLVNSFNVSTKYQSQMSANTNPDITATDAIWRINATNFARRNIYVRGIPDGSVVRNPFTGAPEPSANLTNGVYNYLTAAFNASWKIRYVNNAKFNGAVRSQVRNVVRAVNNPNLTDVSFRPAGAIPMDSSGIVKFTGHLPDGNLPFFPRQAKIVSFDNVNNIVTINYAFSPAATTGGYNPKSLYVQPLIYAYVGIQDYQFQALSSRQTGRPFGSGRGRKSAASTSR